MNLSTKRKKTILPAYYDFVHDFDLITASFMEQYNIQLSKDAKNMSSLEFIALLKGISPSTPLGRIVAIRAETDKERIKEFTQYEKKVHYEWRKQQADNVNADDYNKAIEGFKNAFIAMAKGG